MTSNTILTATEILAATDDVQGANVTPQDTDEAVVYMDNFMAVAPGGETIVNRRSPDAKPFEYVIVGYEGSTGELGVFHWTSRTEKAYLKRVLLSILRKARQRGASLPAENLHVLKVVKVDEVPENAVEFIRGQRHFMPAPKLSTTEKLAAIHGRLEGDDLTDEQREDLEAQAAQLQERLDNETAEAIEGSDELSAEALQEAISQDEDADDVTYRTKKAAMAVAKERGIESPADHVIKNEDGRWTIVTR